MTYNLFEHRHRFSTWAAARSAQRAFATVDELRRALEASGIREFLATEGSFDIDCAEFEMHHRQWCRSIVRTLTKNGTVGATFGRAAKVVAVYLKCMVVLGPLANTRLAVAMHPPIDRQLLQTLSSPQSRIDSQYKQYWRSVSWTNLDEKTYYKLVSQLRAVLKISEPFWKLEEYWGISKHVVKDK